MATIGCFSDYLENKVLNEEFVAVTRYLALMTSANADNLVGTEATVMTQYARQPIVFSTSAAGSITNSLMCDFGVVTGTGCTITHWAIFDASTGGNMMAYGAFDPVQTVSVANNIVVPAGAITISLD